MSPRAKPKDDLSFQLTGDTALSLYKGDSRNLLPHVDVLVHPLKEWGRWLQDTKDRKSTNEESMISRMGGSAGHAVVVFMQTQISSRGKLQRVISLLALPRSSRTSNRSTEGLERGLMKALGFALDYAEKKGFSSLAFVCQKIEHELISELGYTSSVAHALQRHTSLHPFSCLKHIVFISDEDRVLSLFFTRCLDLWRIFGSAQCDAFHGTRGRGDLQVEVATGLISQEKAHVVAVMIPLAQDGTPAVDLKSLLGSDGGAIDYLCHLIPEMPELAAGQAVVLPVQPYTRLKFPYLVLLGFPSGGANLCVNIEEELADAALRCLQVCEQSLSTKVTIHVPDLNKHGVSAIDVIQILSDAAAKFAKNRWVIKKIRLLLQPWEVFAGAAQEMESPLENLGMFITEDLSFVHYLAECNVARDDICNKMVPFGVKVAVCPESHTLGIAPSMPWKSSEKEVRTWTRTIQAALEMIKREYVVLAEQDPSLAELLHKHRVSLLDTFKSIRFLNPIMVMGHKQEVKELLGALKELAFKNERVKIGWRIGNRTASIIVTKCIQKECASKYPGLSISLDRALSEVLLEGPRQEVLAAEGKCSEILHGLLSVAVQLSKNQVSFLKAANLDKFSEDVFSSGMLVGLHHDNGGVSLLGVNKEEMLRASHFLQSHIQEHHIRIPDAIQVALNSTNWVNFINGLQRELNKEEIKAVDIYTYEKIASPHTVVVVGFHEEALAVKKFLEDYINVIGREDLVLSTPGAWQYLSGEGKTWLENAARGFGCAAEPRPGEMFSPHVNAGPDPLIKAPTSISSIQIEPVVDTSITDVETDALVCPMAFDLDMAFNPFSRAIMAITGEDITWSRDTLTHGEVVVYTHCGLCCRYLYWVNFLSKPNLLGQEKEIYRANIRRCLEESQTSAATSIAIPIIGSGGFGFPLEEEIQWLLEEILLFTQETDHVALQRVQIVLPHGESQAPSVLEKEMRALDKRFKPLQLGCAEDVCKRLQVCITGRPEDRALLKRQVQRMVQLNTSREIISQSGLLTIPDDILLQTLEGLTHPCFLMKSGKEIHIQGVTKCVAEGSRRIEGLLRTAVTSRLEAEALSRLVRWEYVDSSEYVSFDKRTSLTIERAYQRDEHRLDLTLKKTMVHLDLSQREGTVAGGQKTFLIRRVCDRAVKEVAILMEKPGFAAFVAGDGRGMLAALAKSLHCAVTLQAADALSPMSEESHEGHHLELPFEVKAIITDKTESERPSALFCPISGNMDLNSNPFSKSIFFNTGKNLAAGQKCLPHRMVVRYGNCNLFCHGVYFANFLPYGDLLGQAEEIYRVNLRRCLDAIHASRLPSIALPLIGDGEFGYPLDDEVRWILEEVFRFAHEAKNIALRRVLIDFPPARQAEISILSDVMTDLAEKRKPKTYGDVREMCKKVLLHISGMPENITKLKQEIFHLVERHLSRETISTSGIASLEEADFLQALEGLADSCLLTQDETGIEIQGLAPCVAAVRGRVESLLCQSLAQIWEAEEVFRLIQWEYEDGEQMVSFDVHTNLVIDDAYRKEEDLLDLQVNGRGVQLKLRQGEGSVLGSQKHFRIRRVNKISAPKDSDVVGVIAAERGGVKMEAGLPQKYFGRCRKGSGPRDSWEL